MTQGGPINPAEVYGSVDDLRDDSSVVDGDYDSGDVDQLLITLVNTPSIARRVSAWLTPSFLSTYFGAEHWQVAVWSALRDLLLQSQTQVPSNGYLARASYNTALRLYGDERIAAMSHECVLSIHGLEPMSEITTPMIEFVHNKCVMGPNVQALITEARDSQDWDGIFDRMEALNMQRAQETVDETRTAEVDPFAVLDSLEEDVDGVESVPADHRIHTGVDYIDAVHAGEGIYRGFTTLIAGPTGGGKTVVSYELVSKLTSQGYLVGLFGTEEDPSTEMEPRARLWAACTDVSVSNWIKAQCDPRRLDDKMPAAQIDRLRSMRDLLQVYRLELVTWSNLLSELETYYALHGERMHDVVIIDWAGPLAEEMVAAGECRAIHEALERICLWATQKIARRYRCAVVVFHQLADAAVAKKGVFGKYGKGDTQNCHKMAQHVAAVHIITPRDKNEFGRYCGLKTRFDPEGTEVVIRLDYQGGRFMSLKDSYEAKYGTFRKLGSDGSSRLDGSQKARKVGDA